MILPQAKKRVLSALAHEPMDRIPIDYSGNPGISARLRQHFGVGDHEALLQALQVDIRPVAPVYRGPRLHFSDKPGVSADPAWGFRTRLVEHASGSYHDPCDFPLKDAGAEQFDSFPLPDPDDYDYDAVVEQCKLYREYGLHAGNSGLGCIINKNGRLMGMEQALIGVISDDDPAYWRLTDRRLRIELEIAARTLEKARGLIDFLFMGEDLGTQNAPMVSLEAYRKFIKPRQQKFTQLAGSFNLPVMFHSCGSSSWVFRDLIEIGVAAIDTLQPEAAGMDPRHLVDSFGKELSFHGFISTAVLSFGSVEQVENHVADILSLLMPTNAYLFAPAHMLQDNTPTANALAMYRYALDKGRYR